MRSMKLILPAALFLALTVPALAQMDGPPPPDSDHMHMHHDMADRFMREYDLNHDGTVTRAEYDQVNAERFRQIDTNGDGVLTMDEVNAFRPPHMDGDMPPPPPH